MRYLNFTIRNYRAITGPLTIDVDRQSLTPIIGINESGKTTILHAIFAFDSNNDDLNENGRHLRDTENLYRVNPPPATITAQIELTVDELKAALAGITDPADAKLWAETIQKKRRRGLPTRVSITRNLKTKRYSIDTEPLNNPAHDHVLAEQITLQAPYILFFDDFRDKVDDKIEIQVGGKRSPNNGWLAIIQQLFKQTDNTLSAFQLPSMEERQRRTALAKVQRKLNATLTKEWSTFRLDDREALEISINYSTEGIKGSSIEKCFLTLEVIETDASGDKHFFFVADRSKGFFWFFNFVMKLEFNPKVLNSADIDTIYLLDEPGSYLHASAQAKLCKKLKALSDRNKVLYCTHSHYLLDPDVIPLGVVRVADKDANGSVRLLSIYDHDGNIIDKRSAFQPIIDALQIKPFILDLTTSRVVITEGIGDYYAMELFKGGRTISVLPSVGADSVKFYVSLMIAWQVPFWALWDNDGQGRRCFAEATRLFGPEVATRRLKLIPRRSGSKAQKRIMQDLFAGQDLVRLRQELGLPGNAAFAKTIATLFYSPRRGELVSGISPETRARFEELYESLQLS